MTILNAGLMLSVVLFAIGFLHKLGSQKEYLLRMGLMLLGVVTTILLGSKLAGIFNVQPLSKEIVEGCRLILPYTQAFVIFVLGSKLLNDTKFLSCPVKQHITE
jgi:hypothetical protein